MTREEIDLILTGENREAVLAHTDIVNLQRKSSTILKTGIDHLDNFLIAGLTNKMVFIGSRPSMGKTTSAEKILTNLLNIFQHLSFCYSFVFLSCGNNLRKWLKLSLR